jgi:hypothetical protein
LVCKLLVVVKKHLSVLINNKNVLLECMVHDTWSGSLELATEELIGKSEAGRGKDKVTERRKLVL